MLGRALSFLGLGKIQAIAVGALLLLLVAAGGAIWWLQGRLEASIEDAARWESNAVIAEATAIHNAGLLREQAEAARQIAQRSIALRQDGDRITAEANALRKRLHDAQAACRVRPDARDDFRRFVQ